MNENYGYRRKIVGVGVSVIGVVIYLIIRGLSVAVPLYRGFTLAHFCPVSFGIGVFLFVFSKYKNTENKVQKTFNRIFLSALMTTLISFFVLRNFKQYVDANVLSVVLFFLVIHALFVGVFSLKKLKNKRFYLISSAVFVGGFIIFLSV